jgi:hypothetical protein
LQNITTFFASIFFYQYFEKSPSFSSSRWPTAGGALAPALEATSGELVPGARRVTVRSLQAAGGA